MVLRRLLLWTFCCRISSYEKC